MQPQVQPFVPNPFRCATQVSDSESSDSESESDDKSIDRSSDREKELTRQGFITGEWNMDWREKGTEIK